MVLHVRGSGQKRSDPASMKCVKKCGQRYHFLQDTDRSVQELFSKVLEMVGNKKNKFFIPAGYEDFMKTEFESWEKKRILNMNTKLTQELASQLRETELIKELDDFRINESNPGRLLDPPQQRECEVRMEDCGAEKDNTEKEPEPSGTRKRRGSKDLDHPNLSTDRKHHYLDTNGHLGQTLSLSHHL
ncbi:hypothetical protein KOW79_015173 [Hemibagrus wyckioides]|uniref:Uncharacterized protein n=1 Tax=Hemibagrus wyckioides TaxID=337641 RepID=A0A9D3NG97_9TELE|nr:hypothetical protein KOW79_015173 [Hemibagrus wyckioides]